ncbi:MAG TPA: toxin-antitoxin system HicB family antitoxin [Micromonosporaceae bacterium]|nr:toxin-antitoxin system HicB family antitoxin [Micromonosporaceae bacterium]
MDLTPYIESLRRDLATAAAPGGPDISRAAELLAGSLEASARLNLLDALSQAADEITAQLAAASVDVRLRGRQAEFVVTETEPAAAPSPPPTTEASGDTARITLRLPESLKDSVERAAAAEGISVNAWLVRAVMAAVQGFQGGPPRPPTTGRGMPRRITGFGRA